MNSNTTPLVLAMFTIFSALSTAAGTLPSAIAQVEGTPSDDQEGLVGGIISNILDGSDNDDEQNGSDSEAETDQDSTHSSTANSDQEDKRVDQGDVTILGDNAADLHHTNVGEEEQSKSLTDYRQQPEDAVFCFEQDLPRAFFCFDTFEECKKAEDLVNGAEEVLGGVILGCEGFETPPPDALSCSVEGGQNIRCEVTQIPR